MTLICGVTGETPQAPGPFYIAATPGVWLHMAVGPTAFAAIPEGAKDQCRRLAGDLGANVFLGDSVPARASNGWDSTNMRPGEFLFSLAERDVKKFLGPYSQMLASELEKYEPHPLIERWLELKAAFQWFYYRSFPGRSGLRLALLKEGAATKDLSRELIESTRKEFSISTGKADRADTSSQVIWDTAMDQVVAILRGLIAQNRNKELPRKGPHLDWLATNVPALLS